MKTIWKFPFNVADDVEIQMPEHAHIIHIDVQLGQPCMWAIVNPDAPKEIRRFVIRGTGQPFPDHEAIEHLGTFQTRRGNMGEVMVWHVFRNPE